MDVLTWSTYVCSAQLSNISWPTKSFREKLSDVPASQNKHGKTGHAGTPHSFEGCNRVGFI